MPVTRFLLVPGRGVPRPEHWQRRWAAAHPDYRWAPEPPGPPLVFGTRVAALHQAITAADEPAVLIAHSAGCVTTVLWAAEHTGPVRGALLVTPPHLADTRRLDASGTPRPVPRTRLPFPAIVVASRTDPYTTAAEFEAMAEDWGARLFDAGDAGHLDSANGFGPWPEGERLVSSLV